MSRACRFRTRKSRSESITEDEWDAYAVVALCEALEKVAFMDRKLQTDPPITVNLGTPEGFVDAICICTEVSPLGGQTLNLLNRSADIPLSILN